MSDTKQLINSLDQKVDQLVSKLKLENESSLKKDAEISELRNELSVQAESLEKLKNEIDLANNAESNKGQENAGDAKQKIDELVNEIDKCISLIKV